MDCFRSRPCPCNCLGGVGGRACSGKYRVSRIEMVNSFGAGKLVGQRSGCCRTSCSVIAPRVSLPDDLVMDICSGWAMFRQLHVFCTNRTRAVHGPLTCGSRALS